ncbi:MAG TPA: nuclear transport factor 2 family protein [Chitinophagaceae bacterium]
MKRVLLTVLTLASLAASLAATAQEVKTKEKTAAGAKTKTKADAEKVKVKTETADGKETKITTEADKVVIKGEGVGNQFDTSAARSAMGGANLDAARQEIATNNQLWGQSFVKGDSASFIGLYHPEARIYPPNMAMLHSRTDLGRMLAGVPGSGIQSANLMTTDIISSGDLVIETGTYEMRDATKTVDRGKYMVVWKQDNGRWRIYRDIWNSDMPAGQH